jgi:hypothetical protein
MIQPVLPLHECADPAAIEPLHSTTDSVADPLQSLADSVTNSTAASAAPTEIS